MRRVLLTIMALVGTLTLQLPAEAASSGYSLFGDAQAVSGGDGSPTAIQIESSSAVSPGYGGINFDVPSGMTLSQLNNLATSYEFTAGTCAGGAPRFSVDVTNGSNSGTINIYLGPAPNYTGCPQDVWQDSGNLASPANLVDTSQLPGGAFYQPYAAAQASYGSYDVTGISLVTDSDWVAGNDPQTVLVDNTQINTATYSYESADTCKKGGWMAYTGAPGPFKNQGDCVSYYASGKN